MFDGQLPQLLKGDLLHILQFILSSHVIKVLLTSTGFMDFSNDLYGHKGVMVLRHKVS